ncbi:MAG: hypothetical protein GF398_02565 [Chitinivibrionales bacterium]|nr:hypothetical protein [Chitinivibrionales bacterium]
MRVTAIIAISAVIIFWPAGAHASSWAQISQKFRSCESKFKRCERHYAAFTSQLRRVTTLQRSAGAASRSQQDELLQSIDAKDTYFKNRIDRIARMSKKIGKDIRTGSSSGSSCPNCIVSSVNLYCRQCESLFGDLNEISAQLRRKENKLVRDRNAAALIARNDNILQQAAPQTASSVSATSLEEARAKQKLAKKKLAAGKRREAMTLALDAQALLDAVYADAPSQTEELEALLDRGKVLCATSDSKTAGTVYEKAVQHYEKYRWLASENKTHEAAQEKAIARQLIKQAIQLATRQK